MIDWNEILRRAAAGNPEPAHRVTKSDAEWRAELSAEQYQVTRHAATERPFSSAMCAVFEAGEYACVCCGEKLFDAQTKFDSGTGWPSFQQPISDAAIAYLSDDAYGMRRIETVCNVCQAHLGHVFPDGPPPSGLRYCMNALALKKLGEH